MRTSPSLCRRLGFFACHSLYEAPRSLLRATHFTRLNDRGSPSGGPCDTMHVYVCACRMRIGIIKLTVCITKPVSQARFPHVSYTLLG